ncbi:MAG: ABC transporter ATP-binding protein [Ectothiorhodospiraceae bacterium AqS1]|nr:ABC transporter ATP-binding protein [Ectothiorhodospiraceae bacterium AqS1]
MSAPASEKRLLETQGLEAFYGDFQALFGIDLTVAEGETVAVIGANGAGKSAFLRSITGMIGVSREAVRFEGRPIGGLPVEAIARAGIAMVPEGRRLFPSLSVEENLLMGGGVGRAGYWGLERVYALFPALVERRRSPGTRLSGGQQQMVAIGRALMANPRLLLCDEISLGLAPIVIKDIYAALPSILAQGTGIVIVEQDIRQALAVADRVYCFLKGRVSLCGRPDALTQPRIVQAYFGG